MGKNVLMNSPGALLAILVGLAIAFFTWQANGSGELRLQASTLRRNESPSTFQIVLILRALLGLLCLVAGVWGIFGAAPHG
jgi:hypothetical protein